MQSLEPRVRLCGHGGKAGLDLRRVMRRTGKSHPPTLHTAGSGNPKVKTQPIECCHLRLLRIYIAKDTGKQQQRLCLVGIDFMNRFEASSASGSTAAVA